MPDANTIWIFREALTRAQIEGKPAIQVLFSAYEAALRKAGFLAMGGQIIDATVVAALKRGRTQAAQHRGREDGAEGRARAGGLGLQTG